MAQGRQIAVVIPAFNEATTLPDIVQRSVAFADQVWVVDDGSTDETAELLTKLPCSGIVHPRNLGKGASLRTGLIAALADHPDAIVTLDADGQHDPEAIPELVSKFEASGADLVIAARILQRRTMPALRRFGNGFADFWLGLAGRCHVRDSQSGFRLYSPRLLHSLPIKEVSGDRFDFEGRLLIESCRRGFPLAEFAIPASYPPAGMASHYRPFWDTARIVGMVAYQILSRSLSAIKSALLGLFQFRLRKRCSSGQPPSKPRKH